MMFDGFADYWGTISWGVLAPDRIKVNGSLARVHQAEPALIKVLGPEFAVFEKEEFRTREDQWSYLRKISRNNNNSMHYYIIADIYYDLHLSGWFKVFEWTIGDLSIKAFLFREDQSKTPRVWLLHLKPDSSAEATIHETGPEGQILVREGDRELQWTLSNNSVVIGDLKTKN